MGSGPSQWSDRSAIAFGPIASSHLVVKVAHDWVAAAVLDGLERVVHHPVQRHTQDRADLVAPAAFPCARPPRAPGPRVAPLLVQRAHHIWSSTMFLNTQDTGPLGRMFCAGAREKGEGAWWSRGSSDLPCVNHHLGGTGGRRCRRRTGTVPTHLDVDEASGAVQRPAALKVAVQLRASHAGARTRKERRRGQMGHGALL